MAGKISIFTCVIILLNLLELNAASNEKEGNYPESMSLLCGNSDTVVEHPLFDKLQLVKATLKLHPEQNKFNVSEFLNLQDCLLLASLLNDSVPSKVFPVEDSHANQLLKDHENILRFAVYYYDDFLIARLAEKLFGLINPRTRRDFLTLVYNCKGSDEDSAMVFRVFFLKQAEIACTLSPREQGLFLITFSGLVTADVETFKRFTFLSIECIELEEYESQWIIDDSKFILGNGFSQNEWKLQVQDGNSHYEIALLLTQPMFGPEISRTSSFLQVLSLFRRGFEEQTVQKHMINAVHCALDMDLLDLVVEWFELVGSHDSSCTMCIKLLFRGIKDDIIEFARCASKKI